LSLTRYLPPARMFKNLLILPRKGEIDNSGNLWVNDFMDKELFKKLQAGRKRYQTKRTKERVRWEKKLFKEGFGEIKKLNKRELFLCGVMLYWAEGFKHKDESGLGLATSDPRMAKFYLKWLEKCLGIGKDQLILKVTANESHQYRIDRIESFWSKELKVSKSNFRKPFYQKTKWKKNYKNKNEYYGVIRIRVRRSLDMLRKMRGWLEGIAVAKEV